MNSQPSQGNEVRKIQEEILSVEKALLGLKEAENKLIDIKYKLEYMVNAFQNSDLKKIKFIKDNLTSFIPYEKFEEILFKLVVPAIKPSRTRIDTALYKKYLQNQNQMASLKTFRDEYSAVLQDSSMYKNSKIFSGVLTNSNEKAFFEIPYESLVKILEGFFNWDKGLLIRFEKSMEFKDLPETFSFSYVRIDLITINLTFRKIVSSTPKVGLMGGNIVNGDDDSSKIDQNKVTLVNIVYSHVFDTGSSSRAQEKVEPFYFNLEKVRMDDPEIQELIQVLQQNQHRIVLPCLYPSMAIFQRFSCYVSERVEGLYKNMQMIAKDKDLRDNNNPSKFLGMIVKQSLDEFVKATENRCDACKKKFAMDSQYQKMLPPVIIKSEGQRGESRGERPKYQHIECKRVYKSIDTGGAGPQIIVEIDCSDENAFLNDMGKMRSGF